MVQRRAGAQATARGGEALRQALRQRLMEELGDGRVAAADEPVVWDVGLEWRAPAMAPGQIRSLVAYSFGNRLPAGKDGKAGRPEPGPVNEALAASVAELQRASGAKAVYAQWEIAEVLRRRFPGLAVESIEPVVAKDGTVTYLSTDGVAQAVVERAGGAAALGTVGVVAHRDHAKRCVQTSRARGMRAFVGEGVVLPVLYDAESGQPWTRQRELYLIHDMAAQMMALRAERIARLYPNG